MESFQSFSLLRHLVDRVNLGALILDEEMNIVLWNRFMGIHSGRFEKELLGKNLFECFPDLPQSWLEKKIQGVITFGNFAFISWKQRPYLFCFSHNRPVTGGIDSMQQDCTIIPLTDDTSGKLYICITIQDATDASIYQSMLNDANAELKRISVTDGLTQIYHRKHWQSLLQKEVQRVHRYRGSLALIMFDLDHFKMINDKYGHLAGDEVLRSVTKRVAGELRDIDVFGRYGGEEFGVILPNTPLKGAMVVAERIRLSIMSLETVYEETRIPVTASLGVASYKIGMGADERQLIELTDRGLYKAKEKGRNCCVISK